MSKKSLALQTGILGIISPGLIAARLIDKALETIAPNNNITPYLQGASYPAGIALTYLLNTTIAPPTTPTRYVQPITHNITQYTEQRPTTLHPLLEATTYATIQYLRGPKESHALRVRIRDSADNTHVCSYNTSDLEGAATTKPTIKTPGTEASDQHLEMLCAQELIELTKKHPQLANN